MYVGTLAVAVNGKSRSSVYRSTRQALETFPLIMRDSKIKIYSYRLDKCLYIQLSTLGTFIVMCCKSIIAMFKNVASL